MIKQYLSLGEANQLANMVDRLLALPSSKVVQAMIEQFNTEPHALEAIYNRATGKVMASGVPTAYASRLLTAGMCKIGVIKAVRKQFGYSLRMAHGIVKSVSEAQKGEDVLPFACDRPANSYADGLLSLASEPRD